MNWSEFFNMGGYAVYVWGSYLLAAIVLGLNVWLPLRKYHGQQKMIRKKNETTS